VVTRAQDSLSVELQADVVTQNIWRGTNLGHVSIQPEMAIGWKGLRLSAWGTVGVLFVVVAGLSHTGVLQWIVKKIVNIVYPLTPLQ